MRAPPVKIACSDNGALLCARSILAYWGDRMEDARSQEIARWWLEPLLNGQRELTQKELALKFAEKYGQHPHRRTIENAKRNAFKHRLVELRARLVVPTSERDPDTEKELKSKYNLTASIVVKSADSSITSDQLHFQLAYHTARGIAAAPMSFRTGDIIGVGSGRAIHNFVDSLREFPQFNVPNITLMSLTGTVYPEKTITLQEQLLDADINTVEFAKFFSQTTRVRTISYPIALLNVIPAWRNTWLHDPKRDTGLAPSKRDAYKPNDFNEHVPTHAFVGVGVLAKSHRLHREVQQGSDSTMLDPIRENLATLIKVADKLSLRYRGPVPYCPVADICHRLWFVEPPEGFNITSSDREQIDHHITEANRHMLTVTKTQLSRIGNVVLIAGGEEKSLAIQRLLERNIPNKTKDEVTNVVKTLCTDVATARRLLAD
jgi:DNA-binding transcriptional regulator LsrR (DeoR family)